MRDLGSLVDCVSEASATGNNSGTGKGKRSTKKIQKQAGLSRATLEISSMFSYISPLGTIFQNIKAQHINFVFYLKLKIWIRFDQ